MAPDGVAVFDPKMTVMMSNDRAAEIYGYENPAEIIGLSAFDLIAPQLRPRASRSAAKIFEEGYLGPLESIALKKDGTQVAIETSAALIRNADGQPVAVLGVTRDITERIRASAEISDLLSREQRAREEAEVTRDANVALTQDLSPEKVLDTLLVYLRKLVPYDSANVMLREGESKFVVSALAGYEDFRGIALARAITLDINQNALLRQIVNTGKSLLIADTNETPAWQTLPGAEHVRCWLGVPLIAYGEVIGLYSVDNTKPGGFTSEHIRNAEMLAAQAASGIQNAQLFEQGRSYAIELEKRIAERERMEKGLIISQQQLRALSARLQMAREEEGTRIAREIHDELGGALTGLKWDLEGIEKLLSGAGKSRKVATVREKIPNMTHLIESTINTVRRISSELRPGMLDDLGLISAIEWQAQLFQSRTGIECEFTAGMTSVDLSRDRATAVFRIFQEILTNVIRHAEASKVRVELQKLDGYLELRVKDNGRGITEDEIGNPRSLGLLGMRERALLVGGEVSTSGVAGVGTTVIARVPV
jgi:PAS domain S-box-containing protein